MEGILKRVEDNNSISRWAIKIDGPEINIVKQHLDMKEHEKNICILSAAKILGNCSDPNGIPHRRTGLAIGKVQSGKTSAFIALTALAFDNNINIVIIFGGATNILLKQTNDRVYSSFDFEERLKNNDRSLKLLSTSNNFGGLSSQNIEGFYRSGNHIIITALKSYTHIKKVLKMLKLSNLDNKPILIIDDEGDQMTLNGAVKKGKKTTTYREFVNLFTDLSFSTFISVTATPEANLLIDVEDELSPNFCELIIPGRDYSGAETFHGEKYTKFICEIPDRENVILDEDEGIPLSFEKAVSTFFVGGIIRELRGDNSVHSMLIHPSSRRIDHKKVDKKVKSLLNKYQEYASSSEKEMIDRFKSFVKLGYDEIKKTVGEIFDFENIVDKLKSEITDCRVIIINGENESEISYDYVKYHIVIGGSMVERGLTVKKLAVTYIVRTNKGKENADTVLQRCRWFGYRTTNDLSYLDVCRVFMTDFMAQNFHDLKLTEDSIWKWVEYSQKTGKSLKELDRIFNVSEHFNPTRSNVVPGVDKFSFGSFKAQKTIYGMETQDKIDQINADWEKLLHNYTYEIQKHPTFNHKVYKNVDLNEIYNNIIKKYYVDSALRFDYKYMRAALTYLKMNNKPETIDIYLMRNETEKGSHGEERTIYPDRTVSNLMQGENGIKGNSNYYPGDDSLDPASYQLQIHQVYNSDYNLHDIPIITFYAPNNNERAVGMIYDK